MQDSFRRRVLRLLLIAVLSAGALLLLAAAGIAHEADLQCRTIAGAEFCTHGDDPLSAPPERGRGPGPVALSHDPVAGLDLPVDVGCFGDGRSGARVQAVYARLRGTPSRLSAVLPRIRGYAAKADLYVNQSAAQRGTGRRIRFVTAGCRLKVIEVRVGADTGHVFDVVEDLRRQGYTRRDRKYLVWVDDGSPIGLENGGYCVGQGTSWDDERRGQRNINNVESGYTYIPPGCWGGQVELHELLHTLGAVQLGAPNASDYGHCTDAVDIMCYEDGPDTRLRAACPDALPTQVDCGHDDYFNPRPRDGSYLDRHWNVARSRFLQSVPRLPSAPVVTLPPRADRVTGLEWPLRASSRAAGSRRIRSWRWTSTNTACPLSGARTARPRVACAADAFGDVGLTVVVRDSAGGVNFSLLNVTPTVPRSPRPVRLDLEATPATAAAGVPVTVRLSATDAATGQAVLGLPAYLYADTGYSATPPTPDLPYAPELGRGGLTVTQTVFDDVEYRASTQRTSTWAAAEDTARVEVARSVTATAIESADGSVQITGVATPAGQTVRLEELVEGEWLDVDYTRAGDDGAYAFLAFPWVPTTYRVVVEGPLHWSTAAVSQNLAVTGTVADVAPAPEG